jgi:hypothetical protein
MFNVNHNKKNNIIIFIMTNTLTIFNLLNFMPLNTEESKLFNFDRNVINRFNILLDKGFFYLGGQIRMSHNDFINLDSIQKVREISEKRNLEYDGTHNAFRASSIYTSQKELELLENMIKVYNFIMEIREKEKLNEDNFNYNI